MTVEAVDAFGWLGAVEVGRSALHATAQGHSGLVGFWPLSVPSSSADPVAELDLSGYTGPKLALTGNPQLVADPVASARSVTPAESTRVALKDGLGFAPLTSTTNRTLECWVNLGDAEYNTSAGVRISFAGDEHLWLSFIPAWQDLGTDLVTGWAIHARDGQFPYPNWAAPASRRGPA